MECPLDTPSSSSGLSPTLSPLIENESDKASDSGTSSSSSSNCIVSPPPVVALISTTAGVAGGINISRLQYECRWHHCGKVFKRPSDLTYHIKEYFCDEVQCAKAFATQKDLKRHKMTHETLDGDNAGYRCRVAGCRKAKTGHVYNRRDNFVRHLRTKHIGMDFDDARDEF